MTIQKQVNELTSLSSFADTNVIPVHDGNGLKKGTIAQLTTNLATKFSNPNLLINPRFNVNQRGKSSYSGNESTKTYTVDRWYVLGKSCTVTLNLNGSITIKNSGSSQATFAQIIEVAYKFGSTASLNAIEYSGEIYIYTNNSSKKITSSGITSISDTGNVNTCGIKLNSGASITMDYFKLECGLVATAFSLPDYYDELFKSKRYYQKFEPWRNIFMANTDLNMIQIDSRLFMRTVPTILTSLNSLFNFYEFSGTLHNNLTPTSVDFIIRNDNCAQLKLNTTINGGIAGCITTNSIIEFDAEIY